jgi:elongation factor G
VVVELYDGSYHDADSTRAAFRVAGAMAVRDAATRAKPVVIEPVMRVELVMPEEDVESALLDLAARRARVEAPLICPNGAVTIHARGPLHYLLGYAAALHSRTEGRAKCAIDFDGYGEYDRDSDLDDDRASSIRHPRHPVPAIDNAAIALPEPDDDDPLSSEAS